MSNGALEQATGSHALAAAAHRERYPYSHDCSS